eukprot:TRINITY_DN29157_c0_g1_i1.p3 TRINITY_DN29157_c0_g1~~TRINITY_DN29157_c0_g1_i1.p3  ORF type:complete len:100 (+),score=9.81 TRINITY_DN29157_c0_g1_i1:508-807(+)
MLQLFHHLRKTVKSKGESVTFTASTDFAGWAPAWVNRDICFWMKSSAVKAWVKKVDIRIQISLFAVQCFWCRLYLDHPHTGHDRAKLRESWSLMRVRPN